jgi:glycosidase
MATTPFTAPEWSIGASIYEVNLRQYTQAGSFAAFQQHLPRLKDMGIDILWFMPITPISKAERLGSLGSYYACSSYTDTNPEYGSIADFKALTEAAHALGMKVIIDWVANHTGWDHHWTKTNPEYYKKNAAGEFFDSNGWKDVIDLDFSNTALRNAMIEAMHFWVEECAIDGFRCDMAHLVPLDFWIAARSSFKQSLFWLAECEVVDYHQAFDVSYAWEWMHISEKYFKSNASLHHIRDVLHKYSQYPQGARKLFFTTNHDENSWNGTEYEKYGNAAKAMAVFTTTWKGMPLIYSGQEMPNHKRLQFFDKDPIEWTNDYKLHDFYKKLLNLHQTPAIATGETFILPTDNDYLMAYLRRFNKQVVLVLLNLSTTDKVNINIHHEWLFGKFTNLFTELSFHFSNAEQFELQAGEYFVYVKEA